MNFRAAITVCSAFVTGALVAGCAYVKHVPPGQSLSAALAKKPEVVAMPTPPPQAVPAQQAAPPSAPNAAMEAALPHTEEVADAFTLGNLCLQQGRYADAIAAYQKAVKVDPGFAEAWNNLAIAYQDMGQDDKALAAFRRYKMVSLH
jgi:tetratricopeptide (TPR) repeat protein